MATDAIAVLNAGSSSLKFSLFTANGGVPALVARGQVEAIQTAPRFVATAADGTVLEERKWASALTHEAALDHLVAFLRERLAEQRLIGVGHRVVHGGLDYVRPVRADASVVEALQKYVPLAPLHQPHNLRPIALLLERLPEVPQVACFDTAFHRGQPPVAQAFALPRSITDRGVVRYGFHGLSYEYISSVLHRYNAFAAQGKTIVLHLGNGASMCALAQGRSVASTMGFTAVDGLPMGTRCGSLDPGVVLYLIDALGMTARDVEDLIYRRSGLLGVSGISSDMRTLLASDDPQAAAAIELFVYRAARELGSLAAALGGLDAIVFTAGIGENSAELRERICRASAWLGVRIEAETNRRNEPCISTTTSAVSVWVIPTNEELMIARHTLELVGRHAVREPV